MKINQILVVGLPRSGTTWTAKLLDSSPDVFYLHEPDSQRRIPCVPLAPAVEDAQHWQPFIDRFVESLFDTCSVNTCTKQPWFRKESIPRLSWNAKRISGMLSQRMGMKVRSFSTPAAVSQGRMSLVWKSIEFLGRAGLLARSATPVKVIQVVRHPCGFVASVLRGERKRKFQKVVPLSEDMGIFEIVVNMEIARKLGLTLNTMAACTPVQRLAWYWTIFNAKAARELRSMPQAAAVSYDTICVDPLSAVQEIFARTGLSWQTQTEKFVQASSDAGETSYYSVMRNSASAAKGWQQELSKQQTQEVLDIVGSVQEGSEYLRSTGKLWLWTSPALHMHHRASRSAYEASAVIRQALPQNMVSLQTPVN